MNEFSIANKHNKWIKRQNKRCDFCFGKNTEKEGKGREDKNVVMKDVFIVQSRRVLVDSVHKNTEQSLLEMRLCNGCYSSMGVYKCLVFKINDKAEDAKAQWQRFSSFFFQLPVKMSNIHGKRNLLWEKLI